MLTVVRRFDRLPDRARARARVGAIASALIAGPLLGTQARAAPASKKKTKTTIEAVVVDARGVEQSDLIDALALRAPDRRLHPVASAPPKPPELWAYAQIRSTDPEVLHVALILSDGRAYYRDVEAGSDVAARSVASALANLLAGIEHDRVAPDAEDVPIPEPEDEPQKQPEPKTEPDPEPKPEPKPEPAPAPTVDVAVAVAPVVVFGLGPPSPAGLAGGGAALGVDVRWGSGGTMALEVRPIGRARDGWGIARVRLAAGGGYVWRRDAFELITTGALTFEPWVVVQGGSAQDVLDDVGEARNTTELVGGMVRIVPAWRRELGRLAVRVGPRIDLAGSGVPGSDGGVARIRTPTSSGELDDLFRAGGLELGVGIDVAVWFPVKR